MRTSSSLTKQLLFLLNLSYFIQTFKLFFLLLRLFCLVSCWSFSRIVKICLIFCRSSRRRTTFLLNHLFRCLLGWSFTLVMISQKRVLILQQFLLIRPQKCISRLVNQSFICITMRILCTRRPPQFVMVRWKFINGIEVSCVSKCRIVNFSEGSLARAAKKLLSEWLFCGKALEGIVSLVVFLANQWLHALQFRLKLTNAVMLRRQLNGKAAIIGTAESGRVWHLVAVAVTEQIRWRVHWISNILSAMELE